MCKSAELYEMEGTTEFYTKSLVKGRELNPQSTLIIQWSPRILMENYRMVEAILILLRMSHMSQCYVEVYGKTFLFVVFRLKANHLSVLFEDDKPAPLFICLHQLLMSGCHNER